MLIISQAVLNNKGDHNKYWTWLIRISFFFSSIYLFPFIPRFNKSLNFLIYFIIFLVIYKEMRETEGPWMYHIDIMLPIPKLLVNILMSTKMFIMLISLTTDGR